MVRIVIIALLALLIPSGAACPARQEPIDYQRDAVDYLRRQMIWHPGEKVFVVLDVMGIENGKKGPILYAWCFRQGFIIRDSQVIQEDAASLPLAVYFQRRGWFGRVKPVDYQQPAVNQDYTANVKGMFPEKYWPRVMAGFPSRLAADMREDVLTYYREKLSETRFTLREPPAVFGSVHRHEEDIYELLNLKAAYERIEFASRTEPAVPLEKATEQSVSPNERYQAWTGSKGENRHLYLLDRSTGELWEIVNKTNDWQAGPAWKRDNILVFDQINGFNVFGDGRNYGVHIEVDPRTRRVIWAVPFGTLGLAEKIPRADGGTRQDLHNQSARS